MINIFQRASFLMMTICVINITSGATDAQTVRYPRHSATGRGTIRLRVFFTNPHNPDFATTCAAGEFVSRIVPSTKAVADAALRALFAGPTAQERARGMDNPPALAPFYRGVSLRNGVATVNFRSGAQKLLQVSGPSCMTEEALAPMRQTLLQFKSIKSVKYAIDGQIITNWDA